MSDLIKVWEDRLKDEGYRLTKPRRAVLEVLAESICLTPEEIHHQARQRHRKLGLVTVYRTLALLEKLSLVQRVHAEAGCHSFIAVRSNGSHCHQLICRTCGRVEDFSDCELGSMMHKLEARTGFAVESHHLEVVGRCSRCQEKIFESHK